VTDNTPIRVQIRCRGTVQGVGFRPAIHRIATSLDLAGWVINDSQGATLEIEGPAEVIGRFLDRLPAELPPLARLDKVERERREPLGEEGFEVRTSTLGRREGALVPPDALLCEDCRREMEDEADRRFHYPFTTCTNCGPRFTLVHALPYDRERTSMRCFPLCSDCEREYTDPADRRFHAEPVACPECGPRLWLANEEGEPLDSVDDPVAAAREQLLAGRIVAVKGLGGFQLACRADSSQAVTRLRRRKKRFGKPFAVMVRDLDAAKQTVALDHDAEALLVSPRAPIMLAPRRGESSVAPEVAPGLDDLGVMLPTTPLHVELLRDPQMPPLVMTSGNLSEEPLRRGNREAVKGLAGIADCFLLHDRDVVRRLDDSVVRTSPRGPALVRRARGWVPEPLPLPEASPSVIVATGGHLQVTACVAQAEQAFLSQHVGDLDSVPAREFLAEVIAGLLDFLQVEPELIVADAHPDYPSSWLARDLGERSRAEILPVQHHLAHAAAVLGENDRFPSPAHRCLGIALDGTGWGPDGTAWGGEWLSIGGDLEWRRLAHLEPLPLVGGEAAVREPWRVAVAALVRQDQGALIESTPMAAQIDQERLATMMHLASDESWTSASGAGRVFEAAGALLGVGEVNRWEGEAAARLEALASRFNNSAGPWPGLEIETRDGNLVMPSSTLLVEVASRAAGGEAPASVAAGFHATFCHMAAELTEKVVGDERGVVALGGGCAVNRILCNSLSEILEARGFEVLLPRNVPPGDGGLSYGQAVIGAVAAARGVKPRQVVIETIEPSSK
jgi:hydrogenase maturation protein HypF